MDGRNHPAPTLDDLEWMDAAACRETDPVVFFPIADHWAADYAPAKAVCATCPVTAECLAASFELGARHGVWGGLDPKERNALHRKELRDARAR